MKGFISRRPFAFVLSAVSVVSLATSAQAVERPYISNGTAHFVSPTDFVGAGTATHLGLYSEVGSVSFSPTAEPAVLQLVASATYTAANGDQLHATFAGTLNGATGVITATVTYVGGTGRFASATGSANLSAQSFPDGSIQVAVKGTIDY
jgi:hypothetical protein